MNRSLAPAPLFLGNRPAAELNGLDLLGFLFPLSHAKTAN
jgi:hypothetical protein